MKRLIAPFVIGLVMAGGFVFAGVTKPETIVNFLDFFGEWDGSVMAVMGAAVAVTFILFRVILRKRATPVLEAKFSVPTRRDIDWRLLAGASTFGLGWGLIGFCPGPALASLATGATELYVWFGGLLGGMYAFRGFDRWLHLRSVKREPNAKPVGRQTASASA
mgnify:CR=1 FL=1